MNDLMRRHGGGHFATMSSRAIADLLDVRHDNVKRTIERLADRGVIVRPPMEDEREEDAMGRPRTAAVYQIGKRDSYVIVAQLSPEFTARLVDRWEELEQAARAGTALRFENVPALLQSLPRTPDGKRPNPANLAGVTMFIEGHPQLAGRMSWDPLRGKPAVDGGPVEHEHVSEFRYVMHSEDFMAGKSKTREAMILAAKRALDRSIPLLAPKEQRH